MGRGAGVGGADGGVHFCGFEVQFVRVQESEGRAQTPPRCADVDKCVVCPKGTTSPAKRARNAPRGGGVPHTVARWRWSEPDGPADEAGWPPDDMGPRGACVRAPVRGCECVRNLPAIGTLQGDHYYVGVAMASVAAAVLCPPPPTRGTRARGDTTAACVPLLQEGKYRL